MTDRIEIIFEGKAVQARAGESVAAALSAEGVQIFRTTRRGEPRGMFCGMGVCQECLVEIDGCPNQRACMTKVTRPMIVRREAHARPLAPVARSAPPITGADVRTVTPELLVIGGGPGGLSAAITARRAGAQVLLLDERSQPGGQYFKQIDSTGADMAPPDAQHRKGAALVEAARRLGVVIRSGATVWGAFAPGTFAATLDDGMLVVQPKATIVATGAYERAWPVPGWTTPGVMTTGAAQTLWRTARRLPGRRILIAGNGPLNLQLAAELIAGGAEVVAVVEAAERPGLGQIAALSTMAATAPALVRDGLRYHAARRAGGADMIHGMVVGEIESTLAGLSVRLVPSAGTGSESRYIVDALCLGYGFEPSNELLRGLGCSHDHDPARRQLVTRRDSNGMTDLAGVYALGDCTGLGGAQAALAEGELVGRAAAEALGHQAPGDSVISAQRAEAALRRHRRFQRALWQLYAAPAYSPSLATADTLLCRCEEVTFGQVEAALTEGLSLIGAVKRRTRVGMGRCQGRYCAPVLDALLAERSGGSRDEFSGFAPRVPIKPIAIGDLARLSEQ